MLKDPLWLSIGYVYILYTFSFFFLIRSSIMIKVIGVGAPWICVGHHENFICQCRYSGIFSTAALVLWYFAGIPATSIVCWFFRFHCPTPNFHYFLCGRRAKYVPLAIIAPASFPKILQSDMIMGYPHVSFTEHAIHQLAYSNTSVCVWVRAHKKKC